MAKPRDYRPWTREELDLLEKSYQEGNQAAARNALPNRSKNAINNMLSKLCIRRLRQHNRVEPNEFMDNAIREAYDKSHAGRYGAIREVAERFGVSPSIIKYRATKLGLVRHRDPNHFWTPAEDEILQESIQYGLNTVKARLKRAGYSRTLSAISNRRFLLGINNLEHPDIINAVGAAKVLGVGEKVVGNWIRNGLLKAEKRKLYKPDTRDPYQWSIRHRDLRKFLINNPSKWDMRRVQYHHWLLELLAGPPAVTADNVE